MALHLIKMAVGVTDFDHLLEVQALRRKERGGTSRFFTRNTPRRAEEILDGGSIYWVIKGQVRGRQFIRGFSAIHDAEGNPHCAVDYDPELVPTLLQPRRPFQGWRYLLEKDAPPDRGAAGDSDDLPVAMIAELRALGLL